MVRADKRADHSVDVLVGNKYGGFNKNAKATLRGKATHASACRRRSRPPRPALGG